jgi:hypothetical protein
MMEGVESTPYPEATETRMGVTSGLAIQYLAAREGIWFISFIWSIWSFSFIWFDEREKQDRRAHQIG